MNGDAHCPTLLHYIACVLLRTDPTLVTFLEDMSHLEAAARGEHLSNGCVLCYQQHNSLCLWTFKFNLDPGQWIEAYRGRGKAG